MAHTAQSRLVALSLVQYPSDVYPERRFTVPKVEEVVRPVADAAPVQEHEVDLPPAA